jgi:hypothetical protein
MACAIAIVALLLAQDLRGTAAIAGVVRDAQSKIGIRRAVVTLELGGAQEATATAVTDEEGRFEFRDLPAGDYRVHATTELAMQAPYREFDPRLARHVTLADGESRGGVVLEIARPGVLSGVVTQDDGEPAIHAVVQLLRVDDPSKRASAGTHQEINTNDRGEYRFFGVLPGTYLIKATPPQQFRLPTAAALRSAYFPGATTEDAARVIEVRSGDEVTGLDMRLIAATPPKVIVALDLPAGVSAASGMVMVSVSWDSGSSSHSGPAAPEIDLGKMIPDLRPGEYSLGVLMMAGGAGGAQRIRIREGGDQRVTMRLGAPFDVPCRLVGEGRAATSDFRISVSQLPRYQHSTIPWRPGAPCKIEGVFPGPFQIAIYPLQPDFYLKTVRLGDTSYLAERGWPLPIELSGPPDAPLEIAIAEAAHITGTVERENGAVAPATIIAVEEGKGAKRSIQAVDAAGKFDLKGLSPGNYRVFAIEKIDAPSWEELKPFLDRAVLVKAVPGGRHEIRLRRIPAEPETTP